MTNHSHGASLPAPDHCWQALIDKDARAGFLYAVVSTGIFCRLGCASRRPRRENVRFFATATEALAAGYRPCRRCQPVAATDPHHALVIAACRRIEAGAAADLASLAAQARLSRYHFQRRFRALTGLSPKGYADACRDERVRERLAAGDDITTALYAAGFRSPGRFYHHSQRILGMTPSQFRRGAPDERIRFAIGPSTLGRVLAAASTQGVCAILLGDDDNLLTADLAERFPQAELARDDDALAAQLASVIASVDDPRQAPALPLDIRGTAFQQRVWQALCRIPAGETVSYSEVAQRIGAPGAARAVATACAANPIAVLVPCHRVLRGDGSLSGYRWGLHRKQQLLASEAHQDEPE